MRRVFAVLLLAFAFDAVAQEKPLVTMDLVKSGTRLLKRDRSGVDVAPAGTQPLKQYSDDRCGFSFWYPASWRVELVSLKNDRCSLDIRSADHDDGSIGISAGRGPFAEAARHAQFQIDPDTGEWVVLGSGGKTIGRTLLINGCLALTAEVRALRFGERRGVSEGAVWVLSDGTRWVSVLADEESTSVGERIVESVCMEPVR